MEKLHHCNTYTQEADERKHEYRDQSAWVSVPDKSVGLEEEFSSDEEVEQEGRSQIVKCRSKTLYREELSPPATKEGWMAKGKEARFPHWKKRWFMLEYPFLNYYTGPDKKQQKGRISLRGACMLDTDSKNIKNAKHAERAFRINGVSKMFILEAESEQEKQEWVSALWSNIIYASPFKKSGGMSYPVEIQTNKEQEVRKCSLVIDMAGFTLIDAQTREQVWKKPIHQLKSLTRPSEDGEPRIRMNFDIYGGFVVMLLPTVKPGVVMNVVHSLIATHVAWQGTSVLTAGHHQ